MGVRVATDRGSVAMRSPLNWALLGLVIQRPSYGYELVQRFERTYGDALELSSASQIYTALDTMARRELIEELPVEEAGAGVVRQPKPHYKATAKGVHGYEEWLVAHVVDERRRSRLFTCQLAALTPPVALAVLERYELASLREASRTPIPAIDEPLDDSSRLAARLVCESDRLAMGARLEWIEYARSTFKAVAARTAKR